MSHPPHGGVSLQELACKIPPFIKPLMSLSLTLGFFFGHRIGKYRVWRLVGCSPTIGRAGKEMEKTPVSAEILVG